MKTTFYILGSLLAAGGIIWLIVAMINKPAEEEQPTVLQPAATEMQAPFTPQQGYGDQGADQSAGGGDSGGGDSSGGGGGGGGSAPAPAANYPAQQQLANYPTQQPAVQQQPAIASRPLGTVASALVQKAAPTKAAIPLRH